MVEITRRASGYSPAAVETGIVHIGLGAFHRAHQAAYLEAWLDRNGGGDWGICAANIRSNERLVRQLAAQGCRYHLAAYRNRQQIEITEINAIRQALYAGDDRRQLLASMAAPQVRIVSLTVTEKGYYQSPATGDLRLDDSAIVHDIAHPSTPRTAPGLIVEALSRRRQARIPPFTVMSCDNMPNNGSRARRAVVALARHRKDDLASWIEHEVCFPSSMVDRIVPAVTDARLREIEAMLGFPDRAAVAAEAFRQWVVEDTFATGRPDWEVVGVEMVADVAPYEKTKLRLLNGAHSLLAYVGRLLGKRTVAEAIADERIAKLVGAYLGEARCSLDSPPAVDLDAYVVSMLERFANDALEHELCQIAVDGSQKIPQRWLDGMLTNLERGLSVAATTTALAAWMVYVGGPDVDDPMADRLARCHRRNASADEIVASLLGIRDIFPGVLLEHETFRGELAAAFADWTNPERLGQSS